MTAEDLGPLAAALAKAQTQFPPITRDKKVTVTSKRTGGTYTFNYAPLDSIFDKVRQPLANNGLAIAQTLDDGWLVTWLIHESGAYLTGRIALPPFEDIQGLGSAITYLRRYALQAMLGIAAEEDDDGNRASGNTVRADVERSDDGSLIGVVEVGDRRSSDFEVYNDRVLGPVLGFRLRGTKGGILVRCTGSLAVQLYAHREAIVGQRVTCWGRVVDVPGSKDPPRKAYQQLDAERVRVPGVGDLPTDTTPDPIAAPGGPEGLTEAESERIWSKLEEVAGA